MKIYTKTGDKGKTSLYGGTKVSKSSARIETCGNIDELNSMLGVCLCYISDLQSIEQLKKIQFNLFTLGAEIATPSEKLEKLKTIITVQEIEVLELWIDKMTTEIEPLKYFILPSEGKASAHLHLARSICRRAERSLVILHEETPLRVETLQFFNRLSDYLFTLARFSANQSGEKESFWIP